MRQYDQSAKVYDVQYSEEQQAKICATLSQITLEEDSTVLDAGCGTGLLFPYIAKKIKLLVGVDVSTGLLEQAKARIKDYSNANVIRADADYLPFANETFDLAFILTLLQNTPKPAQTLDESNRVTKQNTTIVASGLKKSFSEKEFLHMLRGAGLTIMAFERNDRLKDYVAVCTKSRRNP